MDRQRIVFAALGVALLGLAGVVLERWDAHLLGLFYLHPYGLLESARWITYLGSLWLLGPLAGVVAAFLWRQGCRLLAVRVACCAGYYRSLGGRREVPGRAAAAGNPGSGPLQGLIISQRARPG